VARRSRLCAVAALAVVVSGGCGARQDAAGAPSSSAPAPSSASSAPATGSRPPPPGQAGRCTAAMLAGTVQPQEAGAGDRDAVLVVTNTSGQSCTLQGFGGLDLLDATKEELPTRAERTLDPVPTPVTLRPGGSAAKLLRWTVVATGDEPAEGPCRPAAASINVTPPDETEPFEVDFDFGSVCDGGRLDTSAYFPH
jgi:hypothetical protein